METAAIGHWRRRGGVHEMISRRAFVTGTTLLAAAPQVAWAQAPGKVFRLAVADTSRTADQISETSTTPRIAAFMIELRRLGWIEGQNLHIERWRLADRLQGEWDARAREIVASKPDVIFATGTSSAALLDSATDTVPIVFNAADPVGLGVAESLARPGGNATGFAFGSAVDMDRKRVQILHDTVPDARRFAYFTIEEMAAYHAEVYQGIDQALGITLDPLIIENPVNKIALVVAFEDLARLGTEALVIPGEAGFYDGAYTLLAQFAKSARMPTMRGSSRSVELGLLVGYSNDLAAMGRGTADYVDRILKGANPAELPIQQPTDFILPINLKTARELGITIPEKIMNRATEIFE